nr:SWIM zinc finger family protein [Erwinia mallotivora]
MTYNEKQVSRWIGARSVARAKGLVEKAQNIQWQNNLLTGEVPGRQIEPFQVMVHFSLPQGQLHASGECTCPVRNNCRHVAAVMLAHLQRQSAVQTPAPVAKTLSVNPVPILRLETRTKFVSGFGHYGHRQKRLDFAAVHFDYAGVRVAAGSEGEHFTDDRGQLFHIERQHQQEQNWLNEINAAGLQTLSSGHIYTPATAPLPPAIFVPESPAQWRDFIRLALPQFAERGWQVSMEDDFTWNVINIAGIDGRVVQSNDGWFDLALDLSVGQRRIDLQPLLAGLLQRDRRWLSGDLSVIPDREIIELRSDRDERLHITADHLKNVVGNLVDRLSENAVGPLRIAPCEAGRLTALSESGDWQFQVDSGAYQLASLSDNREGLTAVNPPQGLKAQLRDYQQHGLNWMQFLRAKPVRRTG